jgi:beta-mannosidase
MKAVYTPVLISLEWNKDPYIIGWEKIWWPNDTFVGKLWVTNDGDAVERATLTWKLVNKGTGAVVSSGEKVVALTADSSQVYEEFSWKVPAGSRGQYQVLMDVTGARGKVLSSNYFDLTVY